MKIGILGTGDVGKSLGHAFLALGHEVFMGSREAHNVKAEEWVLTTHSRGKSGTFEEAAKFGELIILATLGTATPHAIELAGISNFDEKLVWDITNPLDYSKGMPPLLIGGPGNSAGEINQRILPKAKIVKVFNTVGNTLFFRPKLQGGLRGSMFICGNHIASKKETEKLVKEFGWDPVDVGGIEVSHYLEAMCLVWVDSALKSNNWNRAFTLVPAM